MATVRVTRAYTFRTLRPPEEILEYLVAYSNKPVETFYYRFREGIVLFEYSFPSSEKYRAGLANVQAEVRGIIDLEAGVLLITRVGSGDVVEPLMDLLTYALGTRPRPAAGHLDVLSRYRQVEKGRYMVRSWLMISFNRRTGLLVVEAEPPEVLKWGSFKR